MDKSIERVVVLDFGGQYNQLIARRIRDLGVYSELVSHKITAEELKEMAPKGIVFSGGPNSVYEDHAPKCDPAIFDLGIPIFGICYGMQMISSHFGASVGRAHKREYGKAEIEVVSDSALYRELEAKQTVWMSHSDVVLKPPTGFVVDAKTESAPVAAMSDATRKVYAVQFHPEVRHSIHGTEMIRNFLFEVCGCVGNWSMETFIEDTIQDIRQMVGDKKVLCALSGGVDSSVVAALIHRAIGDQLTCMFVDHGLLRKGEAEGVMKTFGEHFRMNLVKIDARERFLSKLKGVTDPEEKRKMIGNEFIRVFEEESAKIGLHEFLGQGTLYTDIVESGTDTAHTIKSHHNVGGLPEDMTMQLIEPLNTLFKDEVRKVGEELGLSAEIVWRQPFPGPGLGIRVIGEVTEAKLTIVRESDEILRNEIAKAGLDREIWQYFTALPDFRSVGVMGDVRTYAYTVGIRAVTSIDGMTADWARIPYEILEKISTRIVNEVDGVNRVVYDITSKPPSTIEWE
ncbi:GMP synthase (glutamine-hydrolysing) [Thermoactinomyces sp. DSM 45891]|uniref:glutamine-hydrolyzing GMP synthase n=1 Tax=Thermoactinomyces sp. DSM 45891 TaxID=1761907 RepID=UPI00091BC47A|nr:glutamine-hydrolyzing GMP synthase [Thermoactinomyces sp. DSM 45891]SFX70855.1 GMP synthase (glutamine-hydrolysing) [Thermoactinomyces sp. DSM 45891]